MDGLQTAHTPGLEVVAPPAEALQHAYRNPGLHTFLSQVSSQQGQYARLQPGNTGLSCDEKDVRRRRRICGLSLLTFWLIWVLVALLVLGAGVGGGIGASLASKSTDNNPLGSTSASSPTSSNTFSGSPTNTGSPVTTTATAIVTASPSSDCPLSNGTTYTSLFRDGASGAVPANAGLVFTKYCNMQVVLVPGTGTGKNMAEGFVGTFDDCIELCAAMNFWNASRICTTVTYMSSGIRPGNCWLTGGTWKWGPGNGSGLGIGLLQ